MIEYDLVARDVSPRTYRPWYEWTLAPSASCDVTAVRRIEYVVVTEGVPVDSVSPPVPPVVTRPDDGFRLQSYGRGCFDVHIVARFEDRGMERQSYFVDLRGLGRPEAPRMWPRDVLNVVAGRYTGEGDEMGPTLAQSYKLFEEGQLETCSEALLQAPGARERSARWSSPEQLSNILKEAVAGLTDLQRDIVYLRFRAGCSFEEIGELVGQEPEKVSRSLAEALKILRQATQV